MRLTPVGSVWVMNHDGCVVLVYAVRGAEVAIRTIMPGWSVWGIEDASCGSVWLRSNAWRLS